jgi:EF hand domain-containing protein
MTVSSLGASTSAYSYLQSLLPQQTDDSKRAGSSDPVADLLKAFYPNGSTEAGAGPPDASGGSGTGTFSPFNHDTMMALMSAQEQPSGGNPFVTARAQSLFSQLDGNGDGQVSQSEFENVFGSDADKSKVDGLFNALDGNGDGSVSLDELTSAAQASHAHHHGHHHHGGGGQGIGQTIDALLTSGTQGASVDSTSNADGSSTTTISYADGSKVALTTPAGDSGAGTDSTDSGSTNSGNTNSGNSNYASLLEQLIRLQAQVLSVTSSQSLATSQTLANV